MLPHKQKVKKLVVWDALFSRMSDIFLPHEQDEEIQRGQFLVKSHYLAMVRCDVSKH